MTENEVAIQAAQALNQRVVKAITDAVRKQRGPGGIYGANGHLQTESGNAPLSVQIDQRL